MSELNEAVDLLERAVYKLDEHVYNEGKRCPFCKCKGKHFNGCIATEIYDWITLNSDLSFCVGSNVIIDNGELGKVVHIATNVDHPYPNKPYLVEIINDDDILGTQSWLGYYSVDDLKPVKDCK